MSPPKTVHNYAKWEALTLTLLVFLNHISTFRRGVRQKSRVPTAIIFSTSPPAKLLASIILLSLLFVLIYVGFFVLLTNLFLQSFCCNLGNIHFHCPVMHLEVFLFLWNTRIIAINCQLFISVEFPDFSVIYYDVFLVIQTSSTPQNIM